MKFTNGGTYFVRWRGKKHKAQLVQMLTDETKIVMYCDTDDCCGGMRVVDYRDIERMNAAAARVGLKGGALMK